MIWPGVELEWRDGVLKHIAQVKEMHQLHQMDVNGKLKAHEALKPRTEHENMIEKLLQQTMKFET